MNLKITDIGEKLELKPIKAETGNLLDAAFFLLFGGIAGAIFIPNLLLRILSILCVFPGIICYVVYFYRKYERGFEKDPLKWKKEFIESWEKLFNDSNYGQYGSTINYSRHTLWRNLTKYLDESDHYCIRRIKCLIIIEVKLDNGKIGIVGDIAFNGESQEMIADRLIENNSLTAEQVIEVRECYESSRWN